MSHLPILPILVPFIAAILILVASSASMTMQRAVSVASCILLAALAALALNSTADGTIAVYRLGSWPAPYGIVLVLDRFAATMLALTAALAMPVVMHAMSGSDLESRTFHSLFQLQLVGLNGAFLTGDLFNLFVFFEILLLASYALLAHGGGAERARAGLAYVVLNLLGSAVFLIALALIYGTLGTLNLADMALRLRDVAPADQGLVRTAFALLIAVFLLKAAVLPMSLWLPGVYAAASAPVAALFAIMTKVGLYALLRVSNTALTASPVTAELMEPWLIWFAIATILLGSIAALGSGRFLVVTAALVIVSTGTLMSAVAIGSETAIAALLYYLPHTTLVTAGLFLLGHAIASQRGTYSDRIRKGPPLSSSLFSGVAFLVLAVAASGAPPLSGFIGKIMILQALWGHDGGMSAWSALLISGLVVALILARAASAFFWEPKSKDADDIPQASTPPPNRLAQAALLLLVLASPVLTLAASPISAHARATAEQLRTPERYVEAVLGKEPQIDRERRP